MQKFILLSFFSIALLWAQEQPPQGEKTGRSKNWLQTTILNEIMNSKGRRSKLLALDRLSEMVDKGQLDAEDPDLIAILGHLAEQGTLSKAYDVHGNLINDFMFVRAVAVDVLGRLGGSLANFRLREVLGDEKEALVMTHAMKAYRNSLTETSPYAVAVLTRSFRRLYQNVRDNTLAKTYLELLEEIIKENPSLLHPTTIYMVQRVAWGGSGYAAPVRNQALSLLLSWLE